MTLEAVKELYSNSEKTKRIAEKLFSEGNPIVHITGLAGSAGAFVTSAIAKKGTHLFILSDKEEAAYFLNDLETLSHSLTLSPSHRPFFFPSSYKRPYQVEETDNSNILQRAEVLSTMIQQSTINNQQLIVTYPEALTEKVVTKTHLRKNTLQLKQGEKLSIDFVTDLLAQYGFERQDFVIEPGQYSIRGGIVDVFSYANDYPYRVEFFGDDVETIRSFDPVTQLSVEKHSAVTIIPNIEDKLLLESRQSFLEYLPENTVVWLRDTELCLEKLQKEYEAAEKAFAIKEEENSPVRHLRPSELFTNKEQFLSLLKKHPRVEFGQRNYFDASLSEEFNIKPQPAFNKNFDLLNETLKKQAAAGFQNLILSDNEKQMDRLHSIFEDISGGGQQLPFTSLTGSLHEGFVDAELRLACFTDHQIFERYHRFRLKDVSYKKKEAMTLKEIRGLNPGDYITHIDHGIGRFGGLEKMEVNGKMQEAVRIVYKDNDVLFVSINSLHRIAKYAGKEGNVPKIDKLGSGAWQAMKAKTKKKVKEIAFDLIRLYAKRKATKGFAFSPDTYLQNELEASFIYEDTPDQLKSTNDVKRDMESESPMDRLVCGDVGFGKTEIAIRAAFKAVSDGKQVAVLVPTTILALQHYKTFSERLKDLPCTVDYINRFKSAGKQKETVKKLAEGKIDILIGTHKLVGKEVKFKDLGLLIVDEEQKFGVGVKDKLKTLKANVDTLTLTATPIPRTLQFSMLGARDLSVMHTPPANRYPIQTEVHAFKEEIIRDAVRYEVSRGGQVFFVHNRVDNLAEMAGMIGRLCPDAKIGMGHGQMAGEKLEEVMLNFVEGEYDVLVSTTIVESGLDISNANTIIINEAHNFGLSDLHQMRGRVGRTNKKAFCHLLIPSFLTLTDEARKRLKAIEQFSDLGSGFNIAMRDLDIRGAGNLLGAEQSGFITDIGYEMYQKILDEAMQELREEMDNGQGLMINGDVDTKKEKPHYPLNINHQPFVRDCVVETDLELLIPDEYVHNIGERLSLYRQLDDSRSEEDLEKFKTGLEDRFGPVPEATLELMNTIRLRWLAIETGFEKLILKGGKLVGYFPANQNSPFYQSEAFTRVLGYVQKNARLAKMKEGNKRLSLSFENVKSIEAAKGLLEGIVAK